MSDNGLSNNADLFSESHSRFVVSVNPDDKNKFENVFGSDVTLIGKVDETEKVHINKNGNTLIDLDNDVLLNAWRNGLVF